MTRDFLWQNYTKKARLCLEKFIDTRQIVAARKVYAFHGCRKGA